ncbi:MAG: ImmA/IrrE family metallo-endopeptidase [Planctomycetota bacterium]
MQGLERAGIKYLQGEELASNQPKDAVEKFAAKVRLALGFHSSDSFKTHLAKLGGRIVSDTGFDWLDPTSGTIFVHGPQDFDIVLSSNTSRLRDRFTIAHELGHYFLHSAQGKQPMKANRKDSNRLEWEANWFAAGFLMPRDEFRQEIERGLTNSELATHFAVSPAAVSIRRKSLGVD